MSADENSEHEYFQNRRNERQKQQLELRLASDLAEKAIRAVEFVPWQTSGKSQLSSLRTGIKNIEYILGPHRFKKLCVVELTGFAVIAKNRHPFHAVDLLHLVKPRDKLLKQKSYLIRYKFVVLKQLRTNGRLDSRPITELNSLYQMEKSYQKLAKVDSSILRKYVQLKSQLKNVVLKISDVIAAQAKCTSIISCTSIQHHNADGCPMCGVIHLGASATLCQYVQSKNRQNGVMSLQKLEFEVNLLAEEREVNEQALTATHAELNDFEAELYRLVRINIQQWWSSIRARRQCGRQESRRAHSLYYYRIRRLATLKKEVDWQYSQSCSLVLNTDELACKYSELRGELEEYATVKAKRKSERFERHARLLLANLRIAVLKMKRRKQRAEDKRRANEDLIAARIQQLRKQKALSIMRRRVHVLDSRHWFCIRPQCNYRQFLSEDRYDTHMALHLAEDARRQDHHEVIAKVKNKRLQAEEDMLARLATARQVLADNELENSIPDVAIRQGVNFSKSFQWARLPHEFSISAGMHGSLQHLQLVSQQGDVLHTPSSLPLNQSMLRIGSLDTCECAVRLSGAALTERRVAKIHCLLFCPVADNIAPVTVVDNSSAWGTYIVGASGTYKVPSKCSKGVTLSPGDLLCVGVQQDGPAVLSATAASGACLVYRVRCCASEHGINT